MTPEEEVAAERQALLELVRTQARLGFPLPSIELMAGPLDEEALKTFNEAAEQPGVGGTPTPILLPELPMAHATVDTPQDVNDNGPVAVTPVRTDTGWAAVAGGVGFTGAPDRVRVGAMVEQLGGGQRSAPALRVERSNDAGGTWTPVLTESASGYIRNATGHNTSSNTVAGIDPAPGIDPVYRLVSRQESTQGAVVNSIGGHLSLEAVVLTSLTVLARP